MSTKPLTLKGVIDVEDENDGLLRQWRREKQQLEDEARALRSELENERAEREKLQRSIVILRRQLAPLHHSLRAVFGEIELAVGQEEFSQPAAQVSSQERSSGGNSDFWEKWKQKLGGKQADIIDALMGHPGMTTTAVSKAAACRATTASTLLSRLNGMNLVAKNGGLWRLRDL
jgi:hypothetical protein